MSIAIGTVHGSFYTKCRNALSQKAQHLQVKFSGGPDVRTVQMVNLAGVHVNPVNGSIAAMVESGPVGTLRFVVATDDLIQNMLDQGESEIYASDGLGNKQGRVVMTKTGAIFFANVSAGVNLKTALSGITTALTTFASALASATTVAQVAAAGVALGTALGTPVTQLSVLLAASHA